MLKIQASSVSRIKKCPASCHLEIALGREQKYCAFEDAAAYGRLVHLAAEELLAGELSDNTAREIDAHPRKADILYSARFYVDELPVGGIAEEKYRATIEGVDCVAKCDYYTWDGTTFRVWDLKSGNFDYSESAFEQMKFAALLFIHAQKVSDPVNVEITTVQPMYFNEARRIVRAEPFIADTSELINLVGTISAGVDSYAHGGHCKMCPVIVQCPVAHGIFADIVERISTQGEIMTSNTSNTSDLVDVYGKKNIVETYLAAVEKKLLQELEAGTHIPGVCLREYSGHRRWIDTGMVAEKLSYLKDAIYEPLKLKTPAQVEKIAGKENIVGLYDTPKLKKVALRDNPFAGGL